MPVSAPASKAKRYAFFVNWDENSFSSLKEHYRALDVLLPLWLNLDGASGAIEHKSLQTERSVRRWLARNAPQLSVMPVVNNFDEKTQRWDAAAAEAVLISPHARYRLIEELIAYVKDDQMDGLLLDFQDISVERQPDLIALTNELAIRLHAIGKQLLVSVAADDKDVDFETLAQTKADGLLLLSFDEHTGVPGPLAGQGWFEAELDDKFAAIDGSRFIVGIGSYGYDWAEGGAVREISVAEAWGRSQESGATLIFDPDALNPTFSYSNDRDGELHHVWFLDGVTAFNQVAAALAMEPSGLVLWRLGTEDPSIWHVFARGRTSDTAALEAIKHLPAGTSVFYRGEGEVLRVTAEARAGSRSLAHDERYNLITYQAITSYPRPTTISRWGMRKDKVVALTFDDGPSEEFTPAILDILKHKGVKAAFFVCGANATRNPSVLRRIYEQGHDIGNHTFSHPNVALLPGKQMEMELTATQRVLEAELGVRTALFRPPFARDMEPKTADEAFSLLTSSILGYTTIGMRIDPLDWERPGADTIVERTIAHVEEGKGNVILLHDGGTDRTQTVQALPKLIEELRKRGYRFVTVHELLGLAREGVMPPVPQGESIVLTVNSVGFLIWREISWVLGYMFVIGIVLGSIRLLMIAVAALMQARRVAKRDGETWQPNRFAVLVPAFNERTVICKSIHALLASPLRNFEIIVVDDGSTDNSAGVVRAEFADNPRVKVFKKGNGGKASALNYALHHTRAEIVVTQDADTLFEPDALALLVRHFGDPEVGAVAGTAVVGNRVSWMANFQALEYVTSQNLDRRAMEMANAIPVVPGAIGAWRRSALKQIGGFTDDTLAEDADATLRLERKGWRILYEPRAMARTEAPETLRTFLRQRLRWMFGMLQTAYKNRDVYLRPGAWGIKLCVIPNIVLFQFLFALVSPAMDLVLLGSLLAAAWSFAMHPEAGLPADSTGVMLYWAGFQMLELVAAALSIALDKRPGWWKLLPLVVVQRFCYRQLIYWTALRALSAALKGRLMGWNKLDRTGRVSTARPPESELAGDMPMSQQAA